MTIGISETIVLDVCKNTGILTNRGGFQTFVEKKKKNAQENSRKKTTHQRVDGLFGTRNTQTTLTRCSNANEVGFHLPQQTNVESSHSNQNYPCEDNYYTVNSYDENYYTDNSVDYNQNQNYYTANSSPEEQDYYTGNNSGNDNYYSEEQYIQPNQDFLSGSTPQTDPPDIKIQDSNISDIQSQIRAINLDSFDPNLNFPEQTFL
ncbi:hypothetical protein NQ318_009409 [Aromia moschata]|uniref:Uncharacterized protein n=1 Tax=Aromia moschata TaxID=1265417 RepID=A0AAV8Z951_9CUCU|nr:hypothetical protein NQ318_009409 [Aromia moschata]